MEGATGITEIITKRGNDQIKTLKNIKQTIRYQSSISCNR